MQLQSPVETLQRRLVALIRRECQAQVVTHLGIIRSESAAACEPLAGHFCLPQREQAVCLVVQCRSAKGIQREGVVCLLNRFAMTTELAQQAGEIRT